MEVITKVGPTWDSRNERRIAPRTTTVLPAKVFHASLDRYVPCKTTNLSDTGALITIDRSRPLLIGEEIRISLDWSQACMCGQDRLRHAHVVRVMPMDAHQQAVALEFLEGGCKGKPCVKRAGMVLQAA